MKKASALLEKLKKWGKIKKQLRNIFLRKTNLQRDIMIIVLAILFSAIVIFLANYSLKIKIQRKPIVTEEDSYLPGTAILSEEEIYQEVRDLQATIDKSNWKKFQSKWYGFEIEYPENWLAPKSLAASLSSKWEYRFQFRQETDEITENSYTGFDVIIYNLNKIKEFKNIEEFPSAKASGTEPENSLCDTIEGHIIETGDYPAEEIYIPPTDTCYFSTLFFDFIKENYLYVIVPISHKDLSTSEDPRVEISDHFPEFFSIASTLNSIEIVRPKPAVPKPKITAPYPVSYKKVNGKLVCAKKNDKPSKSKKNKEKHLDMECCLDPDEYPNPHCYYDPAKYGKYLK